jgi:hypothetical protein
MVVYDLITSNPIFFSNWAIGVHKICDNFTFVVDEGGELYSGLLVNNKRL